MVRRNKQKIIKNHKNQRPSASKNNTLISVKKSIPNSVKKKIKHET